MYNYTYKIDFIPGVKFSYGKRNILIDYGPIEKGYASIIYKQLPAVIDLLKKDPTSRQGIIIVNSGISENETNTCLISIQFGIDIVNNILYCTANYRSQDEIFGRPEDTKMILSIVDDVQKCLERFKNIDITCNVFNYHRREDLEGSNFMVLLIEKDKDI
jgi:hypothetical protein